MSPAAENVERQTYTKTWQVEAGEVLSSATGGDVHKMSPLVAGTTAEIETRHAQLDDILVGLLNEAHANKGQEATSGSVTLTSQRVSKSQPQVKQYTETATLLQTEQKPVEKQPALPSSKADTQHQPRRRRPEPDDATMNGRPEPRRRNYVSDSEELMDDQQMVLPRRGGWRERSSRDKQLVTELRSAQTALSSLRGPRSRTYSESEMTDAGPPRHGRRSEPTAGYQSDRYDTRPQRYVSGVERRPFTTQQTMYTFGVSPTRTASLDQGLYDSPAVPERDDSSREAMARRRRAQGICAAHFLFFPLLSINIYIYFREITPGYSGRL